MTINMKFRQNRSLRTFAAVGLASAAFSSFANAEDLNSPVLPTLPRSEVPTYHYNLPMDKVISLMKQDAKEGRQHGSPTNPSLLEPYVVKVVSGSGATSIVKQASDNGFSTNSGICLTLINLTVPKRGSAYQDLGQPLPASAITRGCGAAIGTNWSYNWARSTVVNGGLAGLYASYYPGQKDLTNGTAPPGSGIAPNMYGYKGEAFGPKTTPYGYADEIWGVSFFDQPGTSGLIQEMVVVVANWQ